MRGNEGPVVWRLGEVTFQLRKEWCRGAGEVTMWMNTFPGSENRMCKLPNTETGWIYLRKEKET